jgi:hypothetical protein
MQIGKVTEGRVVTTFKYYASIGLQRLRNATDNLSLGSQLDYVVHRDSSRTQEHYTNLSDVKRPIINNFMQLISFHIYLKLLFISEPLQLNCWLYFHFLATELSY